MIPIRLEAASGGTDLVLKDQRGPLTTVHPLGGCTMGDTGATGVVDHIGRVFSSSSSNAVHDGLVVLDGSIIPTALGTESVAHDLRGGAARGGGARDPVGLCRWASANARRTSYPTRVSLHRLRPLSRRPPKLKIIERLRRTGEFPTEQRLARDAHR